MRSRVILINVILLMSLLHTYASFYVQKIPVTGNSLLGDPCRRSPNNKFPQCEGKLTAVERVGCILRKGRRWRDKAQQHCVVQTEHCPLLSAFLPYHNRAGGRAALISQS